MEQKYKHGFAIISAQPFHIGHGRIINQMFDECDIVSVVINHANETGTKDNPLPYFIRKKMVQNVYRDKPEYQRLWILGVDNDTNLWAWPQNVVNQIMQERKIDIAPDVFYGGIDAEYEPFRSIIPNFRLCDRTTQDFPFLSGSMVRDMIAFKDQRWKEFVHNENYDLIDKNMIK